MHRENSESNWRVFCAVEISQEVGGRALEHISQLQATATKAQVTWNREDKFHLTLKFFGHIPQAAVADVTHACEIATEDVDKFAISIGGAGAFPRHGPPRVLWIGVDDSEGQLAGLQRRLEDACTQLGFSREERDFHPHLTIARLRSPQGAKELAQLHREIGFPSIKIEISELLVFRSELSPHGARYSVISRHPLNS